VRAVTLTLLLLWELLQADDDRQCTHQLRALVDENAKLKGGLCHATRHRTTCSSRTLTAPPAPAASCVLTARSPPRGRRRIAERVAQLEGARDATAAQQHTLLRATLLPVAAVPVPAATAHLASEHVPAAASLREPPLRARGGATAVVVMACNRPDYLQRTLDSIFALNPDPRAFPVFISQDGSHGGYSLPSRGRNSLSHAPPRLLE
jgi:hypothetical protein